MNEAKFQAKLREYAKLIVKIGANVQKGQRVRLQAGVDQVLLTQMVTEECYQAGCGRKSISFPCRFCGRYIRPGGAMPCLIWCRAVCPFLWLYVFRQRLWGVMLQKEKWSIWQRKWRMENHLLNGWMPLPLVFL